MSPVITIQFLGRSFLASSGDRMAWGASKQSAVDELRARYPELRKARVVAT